MVLSSTTTAVLFLVCCLVPSERLPPIATVVEAWSQTNLVTKSRTRQHGAFPVSSSPQRKNSLVRLSSSENLRQPDFFEDPSERMKNQDAAEIETENTLLRDSIKQLEEENERLKKYVEQQHQRELEAAAVAAAQSNDKRIVLETFEGEHLFDNFDQNNKKKAGATAMQSSSSSSSATTLSASETQDDELWCDVLDGEECPLEPTVSFGEALRDRAYWLVGLLIMQSLSGIILSRNELLLANHPVIIYYLTMMVGAGGNAGNQASVRVIRGIALGTLNDRTRGQFLVRELKMAATLSFILSVAGFCRTICFRTPFPEAITVTMALSLIVFSSICLGAVLPLILERIGVDPAHSSTTIQVIMDILGVLLAVVVSGAILDGPLGAFLLPKLGFVV